jgi:hypothetical protein
MQVLSLFYEADTLSTPFQLFTCYFPTFTFLTSTVLDDAEGFSQGTDDGCHNV